jgi:hypothetical protein
MVVETAATRANPASLRPLFKQLLLFYLVVNPTIANLLLHPVHGFGLAWGTRPSGAGCRAPDM